MVEVILTYPTPEGSQEISIERDRVTFGRGDADHRLPDNSLSRLHATVYRDGDRVWIVDENSSNGTFVNDQRVAPAGTPLNNGDTVKMGFETVLRVYVRQKQAEQPRAAAASTGPSRQVTASRPAKISVLPVALVGLALMIFSMSAVFVIYRVVARGNTDVAQNDTDLDTPEIERPTSNKKDDDGPTSTSNDNKSATTDDDGPLASVTPTTTGTGTRYTMPAGKKYLDLSDAERREYLSDRALKIAQIIGNSNSDAIPPAALDKIKSFTDAYAKRANVRPLGSGCRFGDNLQVTFERASKNAPFIVKAFNERGTDPRIGLYLAMIESEHCVCLQSPTGPLGMFQFTKSTGEMHGLATKSGASPSNPDERCEPEPSARAAASYMKSLTGRYGTGPSSVPLAIGSYNSGEGGLSSNLVKALETNSGLPRDFWTLIANGDLLSKQFQSENFKYVPKFFAAAIIGENPKDFGLDLNPLSTYSK